MSGDNIVAVVSDEPDKGSGDGVVDAGARAVIVLLLASLPIDLRTRRSGVVPALRGERAADGSGGGKVQRGRRMGTMVAEVGGGGAEREGSGVATESHRFPCLASCVAGRLGCRSRRRTRRRLALPASALALLSPHGPGLGLSSLTNPATIGPRPVYQLLGRSWWSPPVPLRPVRSRDTAADARSRDGFSSPALPRSPAARSSFASDHASSDSSVLPPLFLPHELLRHLPHRLTQLQFTMSGMASDDAPAQVSVEGDVSDKKEEVQDQNEVGGMPSRQEEEAVIKKKYGGILPRKTPLISKDHERAYFDSADWALGKQGGVPNKPKGPLEALRPKLQPTHQNARARRTSYASADSDETLNLSPEDLMTPQGEPSQQGEHVEDKNKE